MNLLEGARRIKKAGQICILTGIAVVVLTSVLGLLFSYTDLAFHRLPVPLLPLSFLAFYPIAGGIFLWICGYIVEGFAQPRPAQPNGQ